MGHMSAKMAWCVTSYMPAIALSSSAWTDMYTHEHTTFSNTIIYALVGA